MSIGALVEFLSGGSPIRRAAVLVPDLPHITLLRRKLFSLAGSAIFGGLYLHTPRTFRREIAAAVNFQGNLLADSALIPAQLRSRCRREWRLDVQKLRPMDRDSVQICADLDGAERCGFFTEAAFDEEILKRSGKPLWDLAGSYGFCEGDWDNWNILRILSNSAAAACHFLRPVGQFPSLWKWRRLCAYGGENFATVAPSAGPFPLAQLSGFPQGVETICRSVLNLVDGVSEVGGPVALAFSKFHGYAMAVRDCLDGASVAVLDLLSPKCTSKGCSVLQLNWFRYQLRQKRCQCIGLLRAVAVERRWGHGELADAETAIIDHCRRNLSDDCGPDAVDRLALPWSALPQTATAEDFFAASCRDFPVWSPLRTNLPALSALCGKLSREEFLCWLRSEIEGVEEDGANEPIDGGSEPVHIVPWCAFSPQWHGHLILCDVADDDFPQKRRRGMFDGEIFSQKNMALDDFHYLGERERAIRRDMLLWRMPLDANGCSGIFVERKSGFGDGTARSIASPFAPHFDVGYVQLAEPDAVEGDWGRGEWPFPSTAVTAAAHAARLSEKEPFGAYDFGFGGDGCGAVAESICCKGWERVIVAPEESWLRYVLHLQLQSQWIGDEIASMVGTAIHGALASKKSGPEAIKRHLGCGTLWLATAMQIGGAVDDLARQTERLRSAFVPDEELCEVPLAGDPLICENRIKLHGRADLVMKKISGNVAIIDYKTGAGSVPLSAGSLWRGIFLQLALYGAIVGGFDGRCSIVVLSPFARPKQISMEKLSPDADAQNLNFWRYFELLWKTLNFGYGLRHLEKFIAYCYGPIGDDIAAARLWASGFYRRDGDPQ
jgi:hypothetical protein